eukprot:Awhi_evm1s4715
MELNLEDIDVQPLIGIPIDIQCEAKNTSYALTFFKLNQRDRIVNVIFNNFLINNQFLLNYLTNVGFDVVGCERRAHRAENELYKHETNVQAPHLAVKINLSKSKVNLLEHFKTSRWTSPFRDNN